jgi:glycosyltransferase involved in cell wall biosynthesis
MNVLMVSNTYTPHVGGVRRSVEAFARAHRSAGHRVLIVAPTFPGASDREEDVVRVPAIQHFNGTDFSVAVPIPGYLHRSLESFCPDVVHSHHPFLLGDTALRIAAWRDIPVAFTYHTRYERYTHYVPGDSPAMKRFVIDVATGYANLCDVTIAPSESIAEVIRNQGVRRPIEVIPTGVDTDLFARGDRAKARRSLGIPADAFVIGHVGRLAPEKNLRFLALAVARYLRADPDARFLVIGSGPSEADVHRELRDAGCFVRLHMPGTREPPGLVDLYHAMDCFAFASQTETQGMVLTEALAAGVPVVAVDAPGVREVVRDGINGHLLAVESAADFRAALARVRAWSGERRERARRACIASADGFSIRRCAARAMEVYASLVSRGRRRDAAVGTAGLWRSSIRWIEEEVRILANLVESAGDALAAAGGDRTGGR